MKVRSGWSGEVGPNQWSKFDVELDEVDLRRLLLENDVDPDQTLSVTQVFQLLEAQAEYLILAKLVTRYPRSQDKAEAVEQMSALSASKRNVMAHLRGKE